MPLFSNKFSPKKTPTRKASVFLTSKDLSPARIEKELGPEVGSIRLRLGDQEVLFDSGTWIPGSGTACGTYKENERLKRDVKRLEEENNLLKLKFQVLLDMVTQGMAEAHTRKNDDVKKSRNFSAHPKHGVTT